LVKRIGSTFLVCILAAALAGQVSTAYSAKRINLQALMSKRVPILLEFGRGWCKPCKYMKPILEDMADTYKGRAIVTTVDMDANRDLVRAFRVRMMPTQLFLTPDGKEFMRNEGTLEREQISGIFTKMGIPPAKAKRGPQRAAPAPIVPKFPQAGAGR